MKWIRETVTWGVTWKHTGHLASTRFTPFLASLVWIERLLWMNLYRNILIMFIAYKPHILLHIVRLFASPDVDWSLWFNLSHSWTLIAYAILIEKMHLVCMPRIRWASSSQKVCWSSWESPRACDWVNRVHHLCQHRAIPRCSGPSCFTPQQPWARPYIWLNCHHKYAKSFLPKVYTSQYTPPCVQNTFLWFCIKNGATWKIFLL
jgi:hypothetical protein